MYKENLALNNLQWLICHQTKPNPYNCWEFYSCYGLTQKKIGWRIGSLQWYCGFFFSIPSSYCFLYSFLLLFSLFLPPTVFLYSFLLLFSLFLPPTVFSIPSSYCFLYSFLLLFPSALLLLLLLPLIFISLPAPLLFLSLFFVTHQLLLPEWPAGVFLSLPTMHCILLQATSSGFLINYSMSANTAQPTLPVPTHSISTFLTTYCYKPPPHLLKIHRNKASLNLEFPFP